MPPEGFQLHFRKSPLTAPWEPLFSRQSEDTFSLGFDAAENHCNSRGFVHGGLLSSLADNAMGLSCVLQHGGPKGLVTLNLNVDFLGVVSTGQWVEVRARPTKIGRTVDFTECRIFADGRIAARASATFKVP